MNSPLLHLDRLSGLARVRTDTPLAAIEQALYEQGFTIGFIGGDENAPLSAYLSGERALDPHLRNGEARLLVAGVVVKDAAGREAATLVAPRSAAGPDWRAVLMGRGATGPDLVEATLRVRRVPMVKRRGVFAAAFFDEAIAVLRDQTQAKNRPSLVRVYGPEAAERLKLDADRRLVVFEYEGDPEDVGFRAVRLSDALALRRGEKLDAEMLGAAPPLFFPPEDGRPEAVLHAWARWSALIPLLHDLVRRSGGVYPLQTTVSGLAHEAALLSIRLLTYEGEGDPLTVTREVEDLLELFSEWRAGVVEVRSLTGRPDRRWREAFSDPLTARVFGR
ncbi:MAG: FAD-binding oxidoreductase [Myxococcales bacterium]|nr:MAG: FAD-binding oxidoreductase [Myxococcales bacterium]